jgi:hypothetical protein
MACLYCASYSRILFGNHSTNASNQLRLRPCPKRHLVCDQLFSAFALGRSQATVTAGQGRQKRHWCHCASEGERQTSQTINGRSRTMRGRARRSRERHDACRTTGHQESLPSAHLAIGTRRKRSASASSSIQPINQSGWLLHDARWIYNQPCLVSNISCWWFNCPDSPRRARSLSLPSLSLAPLRAANSLAHYTAVA